MKVEYMKIFITILIDSLCIYVAYFQTSKFAREELEHPAQFIIKWLLIIIVFGELTRYILTHT